MRKLTLVLVFVLGVLLSNVAHADGFAWLPNYAWIDELFSDNAVVVELFEDMSGSAVDVDGNKIHFCVDGGLCDSVNSVWLSQIYGD